ncbi:MAG: hypothetical protein A2Z91_03650 [Deltaproteobacteria bacterium GWA2_38_16]|nr:MAG: hypothetical protein A2Z91_03650 [Deltaproteobacteria bacterium GWA2_38_16]OGQ02322.1 MAG: hypothetical protein A3D19_05825 [Deltaproteobacteria bacterium RIFCSPHIGHO2_02_FULL_38_15]OGQ30433.1 MAG: hypothetical protein A3A72_02520 [Deltaproteobacteria bacterium RIFCSPLOWO2_01_FULL_38_9]OGQ62001.1 MAG: hypothetical protein A3G92_07365 [Deltaproteobacteria bacterium RIFCSPLOWO2_12_FULL_38_8]HBQ22090.1 hypothetical protein [Deltaproteobacteria bacterium]
MNKKYFLGLWTFVLWLALSSLSPLEATHRVAELQKKLNTILHKKVVKELHLEGEKKEHVLKLMQELDTKKVVAIDQLLHLREELSQKEKDKSISEVDLAKMIEKMDSIKQNIRSIEQEKVDSLKKILTEEQVAKYIVIEHRVAEKIKAAVRRRLKENLKETKEEPHHH